MPILDGPDVAEYLDKHRGQRLDLPESSKTLRPLRNFLVSTFLYQAESKETLVPYRIIGHEGDYTTAWKDSINGYEIHYPFSARVAFLSKENGKTLWICHPSSADAVEKIFIEKRTWSGKLFKRKMYEKALKEGPLIFREHKHDFLELLKEFQLAKRDRVENVVKYDVSPLLNELKKIPGVDEIEKGARLFFRCDKQFLMHISGVLAILEFLERFNTPYETPIGENRSGRESVKIVAGFSPTNHVAVHRIISEFSQFAEFLEWYPRDVFREYRWIIVNYAYLSWCMDSLGNLALALENEGAMKRLFEANYKQRKLKRHLNTLTKFIPKDQLHILMTDLVRKKEAWNTEEKLTAKMPTSELLDLNPKSEDLNKAVKKSFTQIWCPYNFFVLNRPKLTEDEFKKEVIEVLEKEKMLRDPQGHFYYPDFRFITASKLGLPFEYFDNTLAHILSKDLDFRLRIWFFVSFGVPKKVKHKVSERLISEIPEPFDSIALRY